MAIAGDGVGTKVLWKAREQPIPLLGEEPGHPTPEQPVLLAAPAGGDAPQDHPGHPHRMSLGIGKREHAAPRPTPHQPPVDPQMLPQQLDVADQKLRRVAFQRRARIAGMRPAAAAAALVEQDDAVRIGVKQPAVPGRASRAGAAVEHDQRTCMQLSYNLLRP